MQSGVSQLMLEIGNSSGVFARSDRSFFRQMEADGEIRPTLGADSPGWRAIRVRREAPIVGLALGSTGGASAHRQVFRMLPLCSTAASCTASCRES